MKHDPKKSTPTKTKNVRVYELAKQYNTKSKDLIKELQSYGLDITNHMSTLDPKTVAMIEAKRSKPTSTPSSPKAKTVIADPSPQEPTPKKEKTKRSQPKIKVEKQVEEKIDAIPKIPEGYTVAHTASALGIKGTELIMRLMKIGVMASINQPLDYDTLFELTQFFNFEPIKELSLEDKLLVDEEDDQEDLVLRAPVVTIMGHVDHGKTSLLDAIRDANVMDTEAGNITQHIGAYHVEVGDGNVVFLDTPGHAAFTAMRARGAKVTDIVVLVVAADDGVMPQTIEAIDHAKAAEVPIVVAVNKIDLPGSRPDHVKQQLTEHGLQPEEWGGQTVFVEVSAKQKIGIEGLLEMLILEAELLELKANPDRLARGTVVEAKLDKGRGAAATVLIQNGTLEIGSAFICGLHSGKVRAMIDDRGHRVKETGPSTAVEILGFGGVPEAGDLFYALPTDRDARDLSDHRQAEYRQTTLSKKSHVTLDALFEQIRSGNVKELNVIVKGDVQGSVQAINDALPKLSTAEVKVNIIHQAVGGITETDVLLASASNAIIVGFNVRPTTTAIKAGEREEIDIRTYTIIYELLNDIRSAMEGLLDPEEREVVVGRAVVRQIFRVPRAGVIAGSYVNWGKIISNHSVRVLRNNRMTYESNISSLRRFKDDVSEVSANYECGIGIEDFDDLKIDDVLECFTYERITRRLN